MLSFKGLHKSFPFFHEAINELLLLFVFRGKGRTFFQGPSGFQDRQSADLGPFAEPRVHGFSVLLQAGVFPPQPAVIDPLVFGFFLMGAVL